MNVPIYYTLQQCDPVKMEDMVMPYMKSLYSCLNRVQGDGYTESFQKGVHGIQSLQTGHFYRPKEFKIISFFRFEGNEQTQDNVIMYMIETQDGLKGTLVKPYESADDLKMFEA